MTKETAMKILKELHGKSLFAERTALETLIPELADSNDERIREELIDAIQGLWDNDALPMPLSVKRKDEWIAWLEKQGDCSAKWEKNTADNKPTIRHSVLMKTTQGIAEGEWQGEHWFQYRWSWTLKDSDVLAWMELSDLDEQGEQKTADITDKLKEEYQKGWDAAMQQLPREVDSQIWQIANNSAKTWEESFAILCATQKAYNKGKKDTLKEQKPAEWSEEDEHRVEDTIYFLDTAKKHYASTIELDACIDWLKSLKERIGG